LPFNPRGLEAAGAASGEGEPLRKQLQQMGGTIVSCSRAIFRTTAADRSDADHRDIFSA